MVGTYNFPNVQTGFSALVNGTGSAVSKITARDDALKEQQFRDALATAMLHITQQKWQAEQEDDGRGGANSTVTPGVDPASSGSFGNQTQSGAGATSPSEAAPTPHLSLMGNAPTDVASAAQQVQSLRQNVGRILFKGGNGMPEVDDVTPLMPRTGLPMAERFKRQDAATGFDNQMTLDKMIQGEEDNRSKASLQNAKDIASGNNAAALMRARITAHAADVRQARSDKNSEVAADRATLSSTAAELRTLIAAKQRAEANPLTPPEDIAKYDVAMVGPRSDYNSIKRRLAQLGGLSPKDISDLSDIDRSLSSPPPSAPAAQPGAPASAPAPQGSTAFPGSGSGAAAPNDGTAMDTGALIARAARGERPPISQALYDQLRAMGKTDADIAGANGGQIAFTIPGSVKRH